MAYEREIGWLLREKYGGNETSEFLRDRERVLAGEPLDYVIGWRDFLGARIDLSARPLIPRVETEYWVESLIRRLSPLPPTRILDAFTGSGAIGIALGRAFPDASVTLSDLNSSALESARQNAARNAVPAEIVRSNVFDRISGTYDLITANPPYLPRGSMDIAESVKSFEPEDALYAKEEGLEFVRELLETARMHLAPGGTLAIEFDDPQRSSIEAIARANGWTAEFLKDQYGLWRTVLCA